MYSEINSARFCFNAGDLSSVVPLGRRMEAAKFDATVPEANVFAGELEL
jgi:hypothetical protein